MKKLWMAACAAILAAGAMPAQAAGTVALVPAHTFNGAPGNGPVVTQALRAHLERNGFTVLSPARVQSALTSQRADTRRLVPVQTLAKIRTATGADYVVYPRVLSVGVGLNNDEYQGNILVNVVGKSSNSFLHTRQVGQVFRTGRRNAAGAAIMGRAPADEAAAKLLEGFYTKAK